MHYRPVMPRALQLESLNLYFATPMNICELRNQFY